MTALIFLLLLGTAFGSKQKTPLFFTGIYDNNNIETPATCIKLNDKCDCDYLGDSWDANCTRVCAYPYICHEGSCISNTKGSTCTEDADCYQGIRGTGLILCINKKCVVQHNAGDYCRKSSECYGDMECKNKHCAPITTEDTGLTCNQAVPAVDPMIPGSRTGFTCAFGTYCNESGVCLDAIEGGEECSVEAGEICESGYLCNMGVCVKRFSVKDGEECSVK